VSYKRRYYDAKYDSGNFLIKKRRRRRRRKQGSGDGVRRRGSGDGVIFLTPKLKIVTRPIFVKFGM